MRRRYVLIAAGALVFVALCALWVNTVLSSDISSAVHRLARSQREFLEARTALLMTTGDPAPALARLVSDGRARASARVQALVIARELATRRDMSAMATAAAAALSDTARELRLEALRALAAVHSMGAVGAIAGVCRQEQDTELVRAAVRALQATSAPVVGRLETAIDARDSLAVDSCAAVLADVPVVNSFIQQRLGRYDAARGDRAAALEHFRATGSILEWWAVGSFVARNASAFHVVYPPEKEPLDTAKQYEAGDGSSVGWVRVSRPADGPGVDLNNLFTPRYSGAAYLVTFLAVPSERDALLLLEAPDGERVYLNDTLAFDNRVFGYSGPERDILPLRLRAGCSKLMVKSTQDHGGDWHMGCRLVGRDGHAMPDVVMSRTHKNY